MRNPNNPPKRVTWGEQSTDEMGSLILSVVPKNAADLDVIARRDCGVRPDARAAGRQSAAVRQLGHGGRGERAARRGHAGQDRGALRVAHRSGESGERAVGPRRTARDEPRWNTGAVRRQPAPLLYASSGQLAAVVPYSVDGKLGHAGAGEERRR